MRRPGAIAIARAINALFFLALGEPSSVKSQAGDANAIEREIWTYGAAGDRQETSLRIVFYRCADGRYRLDSGCPIDLDPTSVAYDVERSNYLRRIVESIPVGDGDLLLGVWQALYLLEHRRAPQTRRLVVHVAGE